jgi:hypothetical protein
LYQIELIYYKHFYAILLNLLRFYTNTVKSKNISGKVITESIVDNNTAIEAKSPSPLNLIESIVTAVALGIEKAKNMLYFIVSGMGRKATNNIDIMDANTNLCALATYANLLNNIFLILTFATLIPITDMASGVTILPKNSTPFIIATTTSLPNVPAVTKSTNGFLIKKKDSTPITSVIMQGFKNTFLIETSLLLPVRTYTPTVHI